MDIIERLKALQDTQYGAFQAKLLPNISPESIIGVRTPALRQLAKEVVREGEAEDFLAELPHRYFEENQLHAFILSLVKDFDRCVVLVDQFLPYVDNWATCDQLTPQCFSKHHDKLLPYIEQWIADKHEYTVRFAIGMLMRHYLDAHFVLRYADMVAAIRREEYYIRMMQAWYFATALAKRYEAVLPYIEKRHLEQWTHNKSIQKAIESYRITEEQKDYLKSLRWK